MLDYERNSSRGVNAVALGASRVAQTVKNQPAMQETRFQSLGGEDPWSREWQPTRVLLPGEPHGQRCPAGCSPWGRKESDTTACLGTAHSSGEVPLRKWPKRWDSSGPQARRGHSLSILAASSRPLATHSSVLAWRIPGTGEPGGLRRLWGRTESDTTEAT